MIRGNLNSHQQRAKLFEEQIFGFRMSISIKKRIIGYRAVEDPWLRVAASQCNTGLDGLPLHMAVSYIHVNRRL